MPSSTTSDSLPKTSKTVVIDKEDWWKIKLEDWKMTKDRIHIFDSTVLNIRLCGIPIVLIIMGLGFSCIDKTSAIHVPILNCNGAALPFIFAAVYTIPLAGLDFLHYYLLLKAVDHAYAIEDSPEFKDLLNVTKCPTFKSVKHIHTWSALIPYLLIFGLCILFTATYWNGPIPQTSTSELMSNQTPDLTHNMTKNQEMKTNKPSNIDIGKQSDTIPEFWDIRQGNIFKRPTQTNPQ